MTDYTTQHQEKDDTELIILKLLEPYNYSILNNKKIFII